MKLSRPLRAAILAVALTAAALGLRQALTLDRYRGPIAELLAQWTGGTVTIEQLDWGFDAGLWLRVAGLRIDDARLPPGDLAIDSAYARLALRPLLQRTLQIEELRLLRPAVRYHLNSPPPTATDAATTTASDAGPPAFDVALRSLRIRDGAVTLVDGRRAPRAAVTTRLTNFALRLDDLTAGQTARFAASAIANATGRIDLQGSFAGLQRRFAIDRPWLALEAGLDDIPVDGLDAYASEFEQALAGSLSARASYAGDLSEAGTLQVRLDLGGLRYLDARLSPEPLPGAALELALESELQGQHLLQRLALRSGGITLDASGRVANWRTTPRLTDCTATGVVPLDDLRPLMPWRVLGASAPYLRDLLAGGGELRLERAHLAELPLDRPPDWRVLITQLAAQVSASGLSIQPSPELPRAQDLRGTFELDRGVLAGRDIQGRLGPLRLPTLQLEATQLTTAPRLRATARGPLALPASHDRRLAALLERAGLARLHFDGAVDVSGEMTLAQPSQWRARGEVRARDLQLSTLEGERLECSGALRLRRRQHLDLLIPGLQGRIDGARFGLSGAIYSADTAARLADLTLDLKEVELAPLGRRLPGLAPYHLAGTLSSHLDVYYQQDAPARTRAHGTLALQNLNLRVPMAGLSVAGVEARLAIEHQRLVLHQLTGRLNDQPVAVEGSLQNFTAPKLALKVSASDLDLDRLLPASAAPRPPAANAQEAIDAPSSAPPRELPAWARRGSASIDITVTRGAFRQVPFHDFSLRTRYGNAQLQQFDAAVRLPRGDIRAQAQADLSRLEAIPLRLSYAISDIELAQLTRFLQGGVERASGKLESAGEISVNTADLKRTLQGHISAAAGPGLIPNRSAFARSLFSILSIINVQGILKGEIGAGLAVDGLPYDELLVDADLTPGQARIGRLELLTPAFSTRAVGEIDLHNDALSLDAAIAVLGTVDKVLGLVPLVGTAVADITKVYLRISGPLQQPAVRVQPAKGLLSGVGDILALPLRVVPEKAAQQ